MGKSGIYFIIKSNEVVYVGKTTKWPCRIGFHANNAMDFDSVKFIEYPENDLNRWERAYIKKYKPINNTQFNSEKKYKKFVPKYQFINPKTQYGKSELKKKRKMKFRKLTLKSFMGFGEFRSLRIERIIEIGKKKELISAYFKLSHITFFDEILDSIGITEQWRIKKPGTDHRKYMAFLEDSNLLASQQNYDTNIYYLAKKTIGKISRISNNKAALMNMNRKYK